MSKPWAVEEPQRCLFVGGRADGQWHAMFDAQWYVEKDEEAYVRRLFLAGDDPENGYVLYVLKGWSLREALTQMFEGYAEYVRAQDTRGEY